MGYLLTFQDLPVATSKAVSHYWITRRQQQNKQSISGKVDQGARGAVTGGAHMSGFISLFTQLITSSGLGDKDIFHHSALELPGFFRPTKEWDILVVHNGQLLVAIEVKSQVGPSFGNNFNNRTEEALGSALDLWTAFREGAFNSNVQPFLGYFFMLEDCPRSRSPIKVDEPHFKVFPEFRDASYTKRYELLCRKLIRERHYTSAAFITSTSDTGINGEYVEPAEDLKLESFVTTLMAHLTAHVN